MKIKRLLYQSGNNGDEKLPIVLQITHLEKYLILPTGIECRICDWDSDKSLVAVSDAYHQMKNEEIESQERRLYGRIQTAIDNFMHHNLEAIARDETFDGKLDSVICNSSPTIVELIDVKIKSLKRLNTIRGYQSFKNYLLKHGGENYRVTDCTRSFINEFYIKLKEHYGDTSPSVQLMLTRLKSVMNHGFDIGLTDRGLDMRLPPVKHLPQDRSLSKQVIESIFSSLKLQLKKDKTINRPSTMALAIFVLDIALQGIAPVDLASLRISDVKIETMPESEVPEDAIYNKEKIVTVALRRRKTGGPVRIIASYRHIASILDPLMANRCKDDFLIPCFSKDKEYSESQRQGRLANYFYRMSILLNETIGNNTGRKITYYYARHAFCNLVDGLDIPRHIIQLMIGHRSSVLEKHYIRRITPWEQLTISRLVLAPMSEDGN